MKSPDARARLLELLETFKKIPLLERDAKRLPILGRIVGSFVRAHVRGATLGAELRRAYDAGATVEELEQLIGHAAQVTAEDLTELEQLIASWPQREVKPKRRQVVEVRLLPRGGTSSSRPKGATRP